MRESNPSEARVTWHHLASDLRHDIITGILRPHSYVPSVAELRARHDVSARVVRRAYDRLETDGLIERRHGLHLVVEGGPTHTRVIPNFHKLLADFRYDITNGLLAPGQQLLPLTELTALYGVDKDLIGRVCDHLEHAGLIERRRGFGVFIAGSPIWGEAVHYALAHLRLRIDKGEFAPGHQLPRQQTMAKHIGVAVRTIRNAYKQLAHEGLIESRQGAGSFVCDGLPRMSKIERVQASIREKIGDGRLPPQAHVNVNELAKELSVSRRTVTAACAELAKHRLLAVQPRLGPVVLGSLAMTYRDIVQAVRDEIRLGLLKPGCHLPDETAMIDIYGASALAVKNARAELQAQGVVKILAGGALGVASANETVCP